MATANARQQQRTKHRAFPRKLGRFINLEGGLYGALDIVAITDDVLELQTGEDFVRFDREQATNLRDTIDKFLALEKHEHRREGEELEEVEAVETVAVEEQVVTRPRRPRRRKSA
jgi:hypothetical protein